MYIETPNPKPFLLYANKVYRTLVHQLMVARAEISLLALSRHDEEQLDDTNSYDFMEE